MGDDPPMNQPAEKPCEWCEKAFQSEYSHQKFCCRACKNAHHNRKAIKRHDCGPCATCGKMYRSRTKNRRYCSLKCYVSSEEFLKRAADNRQKNSPMIGTPRICCGCGKEYPRSRRAKYCTNQCRRRYFKERFDRWIANPESVALPQNFDEFLARTILTCPVDGCDWEGEFLGAHVNFAHGIPAREFKKICGFNLQTGLVGEGLSQYMSDKAKSLIQAGILKPLPPNEMPTVRNDNYISLEAKEHAAKSRALMPALSEVFLPCRECGIGVQQPSFGRKMYCSVKCRSLFYSKQEIIEVSCAYCGNAFMANHSQSRRSAKGLPVCCSINCRNQLNIVACLAVRGIERSH